MAVEYNLVILGDGPVARYAAEYGRSLNARVALVTGCASSESSVYPGGCYTDAIALQALRHMGQVLPSYVGGPHQAGPLLFPGQSDAKLSVHSTVDWPYLCSLVQTFIADRVEARSLSSLEQLGVDVVYGEAWESTPHPHSPTFYRDREVGLKTRHRDLPSQAYLIAVDGDPVIPAIPGIEDIDYSTLDTFLLADKGAKAPESVLIVSDNPQGLEAACALGALGLSITVVMTCEYLVNDPEVHQWLNNSLDALGVRTYWGTAVVRLEQQNAQCVAHLKDHNNQESKLPDAMSDAMFDARADHLLLVMGRQVDFSTFQLGTVGVKYDAHGISVNDCYRTSHARIFACGDAIQSAPALNQRYAEVAIAVHHALMTQSLWSNAWLSNLLLRGLNQWLQPSLPPAPSALPRMINVNPPLAYIGYGEREARQRYGKSGQDRINKGVTCLYESYQALDQAHLLSTYHPHNTTGWCKLVVLDNGQIVGAYVWGVQAEEVMGAIALAMQQSIPMEELGQLCPPMPSVTAELLQRLGMQWERERIKRRPLLFDWLEMVLNWQRDWTR